MTKKKQPFWIYRPLKLSFYIILLCTALNSAASGGSYTSEYIGKNDTTTIILITFLIIFIFLYFMKRKIDKTYLLQKEIQKQNTSGNQISARHRLWISSVFIFILGFSFSSYTFIFLYNKEEESLRNIIKGKSETAAKLLKLQISSRIKSLDRMALRLNNDNNESYQKWKKDSEKYFGDFKSLQSLSWVDDTSKSKWVYPDNQKTNIEKIHTDFYKEKNTAIHSSQKTKKGSLSPPFILFENNIGFLSTHPILNDNNDIKGYIIASYDSNVFFNDLFEEDFHITILSNSKTIFEKGIQNKKRFDIETPVQIRNIQFFLRIGPTYKTIQKSLVKSEAYAIPTLLIIITIIIDFFFVFQTISKNKLQKSLQKSHEKKIAIDEISIYAQTDRKGLITEVNDKFIEISGYSREELIGQDHRILNSHYHDKDFFVTLWKTISSKKIWRGEIQNKAKCGKFYWVDTSIIPQIEKNGSISGYIAIRTDITEKKHHEQEIIKAQEIAEKSTEIKSQFLANMSHEIRTPLNGILGITDLLLSSIKDEKTLNKIKSIHTCGQTLTHVINDILDISKLESKKSQLENISFCIKTELEQVIELFKNRASENGNILYLNISENVPLWIMGDPVRVRQIFTNLLSNAIKFTKCGEINTEVSWEKNKHIKILVQDNGLGLSSQSQEKLFQPFSQADTSTTRKFGGSGLGLSICKGFIDLMQGDIWVHSSEGQGSTFGFQFPTHPSSPNTLIQNFAPQNLFQSHSFKILVAEDNLINQAVIQGYLEKIDCSLHFVENGLEAIQKSETMDYDIIFMDCHMPIMDGFEATHKIKEQKPHAFIVALTASSMPEDKTKCLNAGMDVFLSKPIQKKNLYQIFENLSEKN